LYLSGRTGIDEYTRKATSVEPWGTAYKIEGEWREREGILKQFRSYVGYQYLWHC
jgi:hypothetical protein